MVETPAPTPFMPGSAVGVAVMVGTAAPTAVMTPADT
jgi:hypothetical protein